MNGVSGTSFVAPQISGAIAILAEAFPNHTPAQLTDRLLASADNSFFSHDSAVTFGNGVSHGYDDEFGHGIMDIYAALNPITTSAYTRIYTGTSTEVGEEYQLGNSKLYTSNSIGDSFQKGLVGEIGYTYDDLGGGFEYDMSYHVNLLNNLDHSFSLNEELNQLSTSSGSLVDTKNSYPKNEISIGQAALPVKNFFEDKNSLTNLLEFLPSYLDSDRNSIGLGKSISLSNSTIEVGLTMPIDRRDGVKNGSRSNLV